MVTCRDLTENEADLKKIGELFLTLQTSATPTSLLLPWFPSPARQMAKKATTDMYNMVYTYVEARRHAELTSDAIDFLIADGDTSQHIVAVGPPPRLARDSVKSDPTLLVRQGGALCWYH